MSPISTLDNILLADLRAHPGCHASRLAADGNAGAVAAQLGRLARLGFVRIEPGPPARYWFRAQPGVQLRLPRRAA